MTMSPESASEISLLTPEMSATEIGRVKALFIRRQIVLNKLNELDDSLKRFTENYGIEQVEVSTRATIEPYSSFTDRLPASADITVEYNPMEEA